jgi:hypothetical protein
MPKNDQNDHSIDDGNRINGVENEVPEAKSKEKWHITSGACSNILQLQ